MKYFGLFSVFLAMGMAGCQSTLIDFENLSSVTTSSPPQAVSPGDSFPVGTTLIDNSSGVQFVVLPFRWNTATPPFWTHDGFVEIVQDNQAGGTGNEVHFDNACLGIVSPRPISIKKLVFWFGDHGGNINLIENGDLHHPEDFKLLPSPLPSGLIVDVTSGGPLGSLRLSGNMDRFYYAFPPSIPVRQYSAVIGGGQELWIDNLEFEFLSTP